MSAGDGTTSNSEVDPPGAHEQLQRLGKYEIRKRLGAGGMGAVFLATDHDLKRLVALKVLPKDRAENPTLVRRFKSEAQAVAQLRHDNIVAIYEAGEIDGFPYIALEYVDGVDLLTLIQTRGVLPPKRSLKIIRQTAEALHHAWERNIVHRDIKPANLLIRPDGTVKLTDLGLARSVDDTLDTSITRAGTTVGTVDYISPEQACDSKAADIRSDIYSLGCTWYHMLVGTPPYPDGDLRNKLQGHLNQPPPDPRASNDQVPEAYVAVLHRMMAKKPEDRYQTPAELLADLNKVVASSTLSDHLLQSLVEDDDPPAQKPTAPSRPSESRSAARSTSPSKSSKKSNQSAPEQKKSRGRTSGQSSAEDQEALPSRETTAKRFKVDPKKPRSESRRGTTAPVNESPDTPRSGAEGARDEEHVSRKLPVKGRQADKPPRLNIDLDVVRIGLIGLVAAVMVGGVWWVASRWDEGGNSQTQVQREDRDLHDSDPTAGQDGQPTTPEEPVAPQNQVIALLATEQRQARRDGPAFPGSEDLNPTSAASREFVPDWVYLLRDQTMKLPAALVVQSPPTANTLSSLADALDRGRGPVRLIELRGTGPFPLPTKSLNNVQRLVIRAAEGSRPLVVVSAAETPADRPHLSLAHGVLALEGIDLLVHGGPKDSARSLLGVHSGTIVLRNCTVTVPEPSGPVTVCQAIGSPDGSDPARVLLERTLLRGGAVTAAQAQGGYLDVVAGGSLLASKTGPLFRIDVDGTSQAPEPNAPAPPVSQEVSTEAPVATPEAAAPATPSSEAPPPTPPSMLRVLGSILVSGGEGIRLQYQASPRIGRCVIQVRRSICAAAEGEQPVLLTLSPWPLRASNLAGETRAPGLRWRQEFSQLADWDSLIRGESQTGTATVKTGTEWQAFWSIPAEIGSISETARLPADVPSQASDALRTQLAARVPQDLRNGLDVGIASPLPPTPDDEIGRILLLANRPRLPDGFRTLPPTDTVVKFDLRTDQNRIATALESTETADGAHIQLVGFGLRDLPPLHIKGKSLRIEFVQEGGDAPLTIRPGPSKGDAPEAMITIEDGRIDLVNARIQMPPSASRGVPSKLLLVRDGDFSLRRCTITGSLRNDASQPPLIEWVGKPGNRGFGFVTDTLVTGSASLLSTEIDSRLLEIRNSILVSRGNVLAIKSPRPATNASNGWVNLEGCTLLAGSAAVDVSGALSPQPGSGPRLMATECIWGTAPGANAARVNLLTHPQGMTSGNLLDWWEQRNGYLPTLVRYRAPSGSTSDVPQDFEADWRMFWPAGHVERPVLGNSGVVFGTVLSSLDNLRPSDFSLTPGCAAVRAAADGGPIGARPGNLGASGESTGSRSSPNTPPQAPQAPQAPRSPQSPPQAPPKPPPSPPTPPTGR